MIFTPDFVGLTWSEFIFVQFVLKPFHIAVFSVTVTAPEVEGTFSAEVIVDTQFEVCSYLLLRKISIFSKWLMIGCGFVSIKLFISSLYLTFSIRK